MKGEWAKLLAPHIKRFELCAKMGLNCVHNPRGSAAMAGLLGDLARILDMAAKAVAERKRQSTRG